MNKLKRGAEHIDRRAFLREQAYRAHDSELQFFLQVNQAAIDTGSLAVKTAFLINGGAAVAMLAFIGALAGQGRIGSEDLRMLAESLSLFAFGVAFAGGAACFGYLANSATAEFSRTKQRVWNYPYTVGGKTRYQVLRKLFMLGAVGCAAASLAVFATGLFQVQSAITRLNLIMPPAEARQAAPIPVPPIIIQVPPLPMEKPASP